MSELLPCPFCGGEAEMLTAESMNGGYLFGIMCNDCRSRGDVYGTEAEAIAAWNSRAAMEFDNWFYLPKPKEPIIEVAETTHAWDGTKVKTDVFYQVQEQAVINWAKELDEHIIKRICEVWNSRAERTCKCTTDDSAWCFVCSECGKSFPQSKLHLAHNHGEINYCPNCGAKVADEKERIKS